METLTVSGEMINKTEIHKICAAKVVRDNGRKINLIQTMKALYTKPSDL